MFCRFSIIFLVCPSWLGITKNPLSPWRFGQTSDARPHGWKSDLKGSSESTGKEKTAFSSWPKPSSPSSLFVFPGPVHTPPPPGDLLSIRIWSGAPLCCSASNHHSPALSALRVGRTARTARCPLPLRVGGWPRSHHARRSQTVGEGLQARCCGSQKDNARACPPSRAHNLGHLFLLLRLAAII